MENGSYFPISSFTFKVPDEKCSHNCLFDCSHSIRVVIVLYIYIQTHHARTALILYGNKFLCLFFHICVKNCVVLNA